MDQQIESTDFDFFDTPRHQDDNEPDNDVKKNNTKPQESPSKNQKGNSGSSYNKKSVNDKRRPSSSLSGSSDGGDFDYSSDSVTSVSDSQTDKDQSEKSPLTKQSQRALSSDSSASSSYKSQNNDSRRSPKSRSRRQSDSRSEDNSSDDDSHFSGRKLKTRMGNRDYKKSIVKRDKGSKRDQSDADSYSSSAYSDGEESSNRVSVSYSDHDKKSTSKGNGSKRQEAWGMDNKQERSKGTGKTGKNKSINERPKTAKRTDHERYRAKSPTPHSDSEALSDSDITDVSPMDSPRADNKSKNRSKTSLSGIGASGDHGTKDKAQFRALPLNEKDLENEDDFDQRQVDSAGIDLNILMKAVGELEKKKRVEANSRRVMFAPMTLKRNEKSNYTFTRDKTHDIDRENDRLLKEIVKQVQADRKKQYHQSPATPKCKLTPSAINREKEMKRIETDNLNFLKRLQKVKATSTISRSHQLREYENTKLHGIPISTLHPMSRASSRPSQLTDSFSSIGSRTRSLTSLHSVASTVRSTSSKRSSRPSSATKRIDNRPEWNDRW